MRLPAIFILMVIFIAAALWVLFEFLDQSALGLRWHGSDMANSDPFNAEAQRNDGIAAKPGLPRRAELDPQDIPEELLSSAAQSMNTERLLSGTIQFILRNRVCERWRRVPNLVDQGWEVERPRLQVPSNPLGLGIDDHRTPRLGSL